VEEVVLLLESSGTVYPIDDGQHLYRYLFQNVRETEMLKTHKAALQMYMKEKETIKKTEQILIITEGEQTFHVFVPFVLWGEYSGVFYMKTNHIILVVDHYFYPACIKFMNGIKSIIEQVD